MPGEDPASCPQDERCLRLRLNLSGRNGRARWALPPTAIGYIRTPRPPGHAGAQGQKQSDPRLIGGLEQSSRLSCMGVHGSTYMSEILHNPCPLLSVLDV